MTTQYLIWNIICLAFLIPSQLYRFIFPIEVINFFQINNNISQVFKNTNQFPILLSNSININNYNIEIPLIYLEQIISTIWLTGALLYFLFQIVIYLCFSYKVLYLSKKIDDKNIIHILDKLKKEQNIKRNILIKYSYFITSPILISFLKPTILLPYNIDNKYLYYIIKHELLHYKYFDLLLQHLRLLIQCLYWFNPLIWILCVQADKAMESSCDFHVLKHNNQKIIKEYANTILYIISINIDKIKVPTPTFSKNKNDIYYRIENIMENKIRY